MLPLGLAADRPVVAHGIDLVEVERIRRSIERHGQRFIDRIFTSNEIAYSDAGKRRFERYAARFAAKEAALKAIGTGWRSGIAWTDVEVRSAPTGEPMLAVSGVAEQFARERGIGAWLVSLTHTERSAMASVIGLAMRDEHPATVADSEA